MALVSLPANATDRVRVISSLPGGSGIRNDVVSPDLASVPLQTALPIRRFYSWKGKRNYEGSWWSSTSGVHVRFESLLERGYLMTADYAAEVVGISAQPCALLWPRGTEGQKFHVPDFFCRLSDGDGRLVDVKHPDRVEASGRQFALTREVCGQVGWEYEVFTGLPRIESQNLRWLSGYRQDRYAPDAETGAGILAVFASPLHLRTGIRSAGKMTGKPQETVLANVYHMLWNRLLSVNPGAPLTGDGEVWA